MTYGQYRAANERAGGIAIVGTAGLALAAPVALELGTVGLKVSADALAGGSLWGGVVANAPAVNAAGVTLAEAAGVGTGLRVAAKATTKGLVDLTEHRAAHILNRHRAGTGISGNTEFPAGWSDKDILHRVSDVATDPRSTMGIGKWNSPYAIGTRDGVSIRVDFCPPNHPTHAGKISTAYPISVAPNP